MGVLATTLLGLVAFATAPWWVAFVARRTLRLARATHHRLRPPRPPEPSNRPVEQIAADVRARGLRYHRLPEHASFAKQAAVASAYDLVLAEMCAALGHAHLLQVLPAGPELDAERRRVELVLMSFGLPPADAA